MADLTKADVAAALTHIEKDALSDKSIALLDAAKAAPRGHILGLTGPPGVGKSSLTQALVDQWVSAGKRVAVLAIDPSSQRSGGALLGDRTRLNLTHYGEQAFTRSMAAGRRLGGLSDATYPAALFLRAHFDRVVVETVGVGQSETEITSVADSVALCIQPGSGDSLQFMKAGIAEVPDIVFVTKSDLTMLARRAAADMRGALSLTKSGGAETPVLLVSAKDRTGLEEAVATIEESFGDTSIDDAMFLTYAKERIARAGGEAAVALFEDAALSEGFGALKQLQSQISVSLTGVDQDS
ncbi:MAG: methylmalonyl Co-A mutase-associated GTPase MeaB [Pseudomonadota bacterium]